MSKVLEKNPKCPQLEAVLEEYLKPVVIEDELLGRMTLDKQFSRFCCLPHNYMDLYLEVDIDKPEQWQNVIDKAKEIIRDLDSFDLKNRRFAAKELTENANDWRDDIEEEITEEKFAERIDSIVSLTVNENEYEAWYDDDEMFLSHSIVVYGKLYNEPYRADLVG